MPSVSVRSKWAGLGVEKGTPSAPQPMSSVCQRFPIISYEVPSREEKVLRRPRIVAVTEEGVQSFPRTHDRRTHDSVGVRFGFFGAFYNSIHRGPKVATTVKYNEFSAWPSLIGKNYFKKIARTTTAKLQQKRKNVPETQNQPIIDSNCQYKHEDPQGFYHC